jgi:hypothetical protein
MPVVTRQNASMKNAVRSSSTKNTNSTPPKNRDKLNGTPAIKETEVKDGVNHITHPLPDHLNLISNFEIRSYPRCG